MLRAVIKWASGLFRKEPPKKPVESMFGPVYVE
jgi:hypothetical protein